MVACKVTVASLLTMPGQETVWWDWFSAVSSLLVIDKALSKIRGEEIWVLLYILVRLVIWKRDNLQLSVARSSKLLCLLFHAKPHQCAPYLTNGMVKLYL